MCRDGLRLVVAAGIDYHRSSKKMSTGVELKRQPLQDKTSGVITWHSAIKAEIPKHTPPEQGILKRQH